jgi:hypothetical protein
MLGGGCDAYTNINLVWQWLQASRPCCLETVSKEPLGLVVRQGDDAWATRAVGHLQHHQR